MEKLSEGALVSFLLTVILTDFSESALVQQRFIEEPRSVSIQEGQDVVLSCRVDNKMGVLQWTKGTLHLSLYKNIPESLSLLL